MNRSHWIYNIHLPWSDCLVNVLVVLMCVQVVLAASEPPGGDDPQWLDIFGVSLVACFVVELCIKVQKETCQPDLHSNW